jgi:hypothetical protein
MGAMRTSAMTGRPEAVNSWFAGRQSARWVEPAAAKRQEQLRALSVLHESGTIDDAEFEQLRARVQA